MGRGFIERDFFRTDVVGADLLAHGLEQVGDDAGTREGVGGRCVVELGKGFVNPVQQAEFAAHVAEPGKARHLRWQPGHRGDQGNL